MQIKDAKRLKEQEKEKEKEKENMELKKIMTDQMLNIQVMEAVNAKVVSRNRSAAVKEVASAGLHSKRAACLNQEHFLSLTEARILIENWRDKYDRIHLHSNLGLLKKFPILTKLTIYEFFKMEYGALHWGSQNLRFNLINHRPNLNKYHYGTYSQ